MGAFSAKIQKSISFLASTAGNLIRNPELHIIFKLGTLKTDMQS
jgi:hypothetical protein